MKSPWLSRLFIASFLAIAVQGSLQAMQAAPGNEAEQALAHVLKNDIVLSRTFGECPRLKFTRSETKGARTFLIEGSCDIKDNPEEDADCPAYQVHATGTIDTPSHWTVRQLQLKLVCSGEGTAAQRQM
ncbi:hypothetical protein [Xanthomonas bundabergensis]|uniref:hypothetical protein n=1 Tax=Xanthomonas bundabergensis TaxID=3160842 RepID=UPI003519B10A